MTEFITRANYEDKDFEIIIKTDSEAHYKLAETFSRALIDDCGYEKVMQSPIVWELLGTTYKSYGSNRKEK